MPGKSYTNYSRGYYAERRCIQDLQEKGYSAVRTAGSHSPFDIFAWNSSEVLAIQVKRVKRPKRFDKALKELALIKTPPVVCKMLWVWVDGKGWKKYYALDSIINK